MRLRRIIKIGVVALISLTLTSSMAVKSLFADLLNTNSWQTSFSQPQSLWQVLSYNYALNNDADEPAVDEQIQWFQRHQDYITELTRNAKPYLYYVYQQLRIRQMPAELALLPMIESNYVPSKYSSSGATGLWQIMPDTASGYGIKMNWWFDDRRNIIASTNVALSYLSYLHDLFGSWLLAIAAYNSGQGTVQSAIRYNKKHHRSTSFWALPLPRATKTYVPKLLALAKIVENPKRYHLHIRPVTNTPVFTAVKVNKQITPTKAAELADSDITLMRDLNPGFRQWTALPKRNYNLLVPIDKVDLFQKRLENKKHEKPAETKIAVNKNHWQNSANLTDSHFVHYKVHHGDNLSKIAAHFRISIHSLRSANHLHRNMLSIGQHLLIPQA